MHSRQQWTRQGRVSSMIALGICIDEAATTEAALHHRLGQALRHWFDKSAQLTRRGVPLRLRLRRFEESVLATLLWGAGGWTLNSSLVQTLTSFQLNCVRRTLNRRRRPDENYVHWIKRASNMARTCVERHGGFSAVARALQFSHSWAGHVERLGPTTPIWWVTRW